MAIGLIGSKRSARMPAGSVQVCTKEESPVARPRSSASSAPRLSPGQASYVIDQLISERRISVGEINRYLGDMHREISDLEQRLASLKTAAGSQGGSSRSSGTPGAARRGRPPGRPAGSGRKRGRPAAASAPSSKGAPRRRRRKAVTPEQLASRQLQGRYLGLIRQIPANKRGQYQKIAKERGREAAVREMAQTLGK